MNLFRFAVAFNGFIVISVVIYHFFPLEWRQNKWINRFLLAYHVIGMLSLEMTFLVYKDIPYRWLQKVSTVTSTFYYVPLMLMGILFVSGWVIGKVYVRLTKHPHKAPAIIPERRRRVLSVITAAYLITAVGFFRFQKLHRMEYDVDLPSYNAKEPLDICLISDIHAGSGNRDALYDEILQMTKNESPDLILIDGDIFDETTGKADIEKVCGMLGEMQAPLGMYFTYGNHDDPSSAYMLEQLEKTGAVYLRDEVVRLNDDLVLVGRKDDGEADRASCSELITTADVRTDDTVLVLQHRPTEFQTLSEAGADLVVAGHTHGFNIPMIAAVYWNADLVYGRETYGDMTAVVTSGVSGWGFSYKLPAINEVVMIHMH